MAENLASIRSSTVVRAPSRTPGHSDSAATAAASATAAEALRASLRRLGADERTVALVGPRPERTVPR